MMFPEHIIDSLVKGIRNRLEKCRLIPSKVRISEEEKYSSLPSGSPTLKLVNWPSPPPPPPICSPSISIVSPFSSLANYHTCVDDDDWTYSPYAECDKWLFEQNLSLVSRSSVQRTY